jgi:hypothetical protein
MNFQARSRWHTLPSPRRSAPWPIKSTVGLRPPCPIGCGIRCRFRRSRVCDNRGVNELVVELRGMSLPERWAIVGAVSAGVVGAIVGLIVGLSVYAPTAWFAVFELGVPAGMAGAVVGFVAALIVSAGRRITRHIRPSP